MNDEPKYKVSAIEQSSGRWVFRLVAIGADPSTWESDGKSYLTQQDAERAGYLAVAAKLWRSQR